MVSGEITGVPPRVAADTTHEGPTLPSSPLHGALVIRDDTPSVATRASVLDDDESAETGGALSLARRYRRSCRGRFARPRILMGLLLIVVMAAIVLW